MGEILETKKIALASTLTALGVAIAPFIWFPFMGSKAYPGQHLINAIAGIYLGPWWAALIAIMVGTIRISLGIGTIYAYPGGIFGGLVVGYIYKFLQRFIGNRKALVSALTEPIGTLLIGAPLSVLIVSPVAPILGHSQIEMKPGGLLITILYLWFGWGASTFTGSIAAYFILNILYRYGFSKEEVLGER